MQKLDTRIKQMKIGDKFKPTETGYLAGLLIPETATQLKIPGMADTTISLHRKITLNTTTSALGAVGIFWQPSYLSDNSNNQNTFFINNNATYDGTSTNGATNPGSVRVNFNITAGAVATYRVVSASMHIIPQASVLNQAGTIHATLTKTKTETPVTTGSGMNAANDVTCTLIPNYQNTPYYGAASISNMEGARIIWVPNDSCYTDFADINSTLVNADDQNSLIATVVGAGAAAPIRIDLYVNFEVTPAVGSILQGMETICPFNQLPSPTWRKILYEHKHDVIKIGDAIRDVVISNINVQKRLDDQLRIPQKVISYRQGSATYRPMTKSNGYGNFNGYI
jgi:hypothetical protein